MTDRAPIIPGHFLYVLQGFGLSKVGKSSDVYKRVSEQELRNGHYFRYGFRFADAGQICLMEAAAHYEMWRHRDGKSEWFEVSPFVAASNVRRASERTGIEILDEADCLFDFLGVSRQSVWRAAKAMKLERIPLDE